MLSFFKIIKQFKSLKNYAENNFYLTLIFVYFTNNIYSQCHYLMYMYDSYGDGWNSAYLEVNMNGNFVSNFDCSQSFTLDSMYSTSGAAMGVYLAFWKLG